MRYITNLVQNFKALCIARGNYNIWYDGWNTAKLTYVCGNECTYGVCGDGGCHCENNCARCDDCFFDDGCPRA
jgi:hypothetical protein